MKATGFTLAAVLMAAGAWGNEPPPPHWRSIDHMVQIDVIMSPADWHALRSQNRILKDTDWSCEPFASPFTWFTTESVTIDGRPYGRARIRKKGFLGSLSNTKPSLKLRLDKHVEQDHFGTTRLTLNNSKQDQSMVNTCLAYEVFRRAGIPTPLCNLASVTVNGEDIGTYINVEDMKTDYFDRAWNGRGNLYEGTTSDFLPELTGTFEKKTENPGLGYIEKITESIERNDVAALARLIDVDSFLTFWTLESLINIEDGYTQGINNYYFHESAAGLVFIPWGPDDTMREPKASVMWLRGAVNRALFLNYHEEYKARMLSLLDTVWNEIEMLQYATRLAHIAGWNRDTLRVFRFITNRREYVEARLKRDRFLNYYLANKRYEGDCAAALGAGP